MTDAGRLAMVRAVHTLIYIVMSAACFAVLYAGLTGARGPWLWVALTLVVLETIVFVGCGMKCPLTAVAVRYGARIDGPYDTYFPERCTRHTLTVFGPLILAGLALNLLRAFGLI